MIHLLTYCTDNYRRSANVLCQSAMKHGIDTTYIADEIPGDVKLMFGDNLKETTRHWFYIWKPYIIWEYIQKMIDGDLLVYADAGTTFVDSIKPLVDEMDEDIMFFHNPWKHVEWCKMDVIDSMLQMAYQPKENMDMGDAKADLYQNIKDNKQVQASLIFFRITPEVRNFVKEWMLWCMMPGFCDNSPSKLPNYPTFQEHRYDQAVLTCLQINYGYKLHQFPAINNGDAKYKIIDHHRKSNDKW